MSSEVLDRFRATMDRHQRLLRRRGFALAAEDVPPVGQAAYWYEDVLDRVPISGMKVARQIARLCADDSQVTISWRALADAVGHLDTSGRHIAYTQRGVQSLTEAGWLRVETEGRGCNARTTFSLMPGDRSDYAVIDLLDLDLDREAVA